MTLKSLRSRLLLSAALAIIAALMVSGVLLSRLFETHVENRAAAELQTQINQFIAGLEAGNDGTLHWTNAFTDPRYSQPYSGFYWQLDSPSLPRQRSRSLWDVELALPVDRLPDGAFHRHTVSGPKGATLLAIERALAITAANPAAGVRNPISLTIIAAIDRAAIMEAAASFRTVLWASLAVIGAALIASFGLMLHIGLLPLESLSAALRNVQSGRDANVEGRFPTEVQSLVDGMNGLLGQQRQAVARAREQAADLAHGFKTPLSLLSAIARDLKREGKTLPAGEIETQVEAMGGHVRRELARVRVSGGAGVDRAGIAVKPVIEKLLNTMRRIGGDRELSWSVEGPMEIRFAGDETDLLEITGNLAENAGKWASSRVHVSIDQIADRVEIAWDDDGPGIPMGQEAAVVARGKRLDEAAEGSGLGLSIVAKAVALYGGSLDLSRSPLGGLRARLTLPAATDAKLTDS